MSLIVGAYPAQPSGLVDRKAFFTELADEPTIRGLELPYHRDGGDPWPPGAPAAWTAVITAIPGTMQHLAGDPRSGSPRQTRKDVRQPSDTPPRSTTTPNR